MMRDLFCFSGVGGCKMRNLFCFFSEGWKHVRDLFCVFVQEVKKKKVRYLFSCGFFGLEESRLMVFWGRIVLR